MSRESIAYVLMAVLILSIGAAILWGRRKANARRYHRSSRRRIIVREDKRKP